MKTSKIAETVQIPIFPLLRSVLDKAFAEPSPGKPDFVFPKLAGHYRINPDHLTDRARRVLRAAGFFDPEDAESEKELQSSRGEVSRTRIKGLRKASVRDFHSFRVTWVTLALTAGVPLEIVQKVTGHRTAAIVMKHYFHPGREDFRRTLAGKMPALLVGGESKVELLNLTEFRTKLVSINETNWKDIRGELVARLPGEPITAETAVNNAVPTAISRVSR